MPASIFADLQDLCNDTITAKVVTSDGFGGTTVTGSTAFTSCRVEGETRLVRDSSGAEVTSTLQAFILDTGAAAVALDTTTYRYDLPSRYTPNSELEALAVNRVVDENGGHHVEVMFK